MKLIVFIGLITVLGSIAVEGYGIRNYHSEQFHHGHHGHHGPHHNFPHHHSSHYDVTPNKWDSSESHDRGSSSPDSSERQPGSVEISGSNHEPYSEEDEDPDYGSSFDSNEYHGHKPDQRLCLSWRCLSQINLPWIKPTTARAHTTQKRPTSWWQTTQNPITYPTQRQTTSGWPTQVFTTSDPRPTRTASPSNINPTIASIPDETTISDVLILCMQNCVSTPEFNPVCGTNGETYDNIGKLTCAKTCGISKIKFYFKTLLHTSCTHKKLYLCRKGFKNFKFRVIVAATSLACKELRNVSQQKILFNPQHVELQRPSVCSPPPDPDDGDGEVAVTTPPSIPTTSTTTIRPMLRTTSLTAYQNCMKQCLITPSFSPVCGTDLVTYMNIDRFNCARTCGNDIQVLCQSPCVVCNATNAGRLTTSTLKPSVTISSSSTTPSEAKQNCLNKCPTTPEYNPVCGSNNITYSNSGHLLCAQLCGDDVRIVRLSPCPSNNHSDHRWSDEIETTLAPDIEACIRRCPVTSEFNPVCGSNNVSYWNPGRLECAKFCGVGVELQRNGPCDEPDRIPTSSGTNTPSWTIPTSSSIFSSSQVTSRPPFTSPTTVVSSSTSNPTTDFTIPPYILSSIFGEIPSPITEPTKPTVVDYNEESDIDPRFGDDD